MTQFGRPIQNCEGQRRPIIIGICGGSGSGKTTLANRLVDRLGPDEACGISFDSYYRDFAHLTVEQRAEINFDHPDSLDHELLIEHLGQLRHNETVAVPHYDFASHTRSGDLTLVEPASYVIIEGILLFAFAEVRELLDHRIFRHADTDVRAERRLARDVVERGRTPESVRHQWQNTVQPMHERYVEPFAAHADVITTPDQELDAVVDQLHGALAGGGPLAVG
jgi:uridine kinase